MSAPETAPLLSASTGVVNPMQQTPWPLSWTILRDRGRLQWRWLPASGEWYAVIPEAGVEARASTARELSLMLAPHVRRLWSTPAPQRVNGHEAIELPADRRFLPRR